MSCLMFASLTAQNTDKSKTTKKTVLTDTINGKVIKRSVKTVTEKEQEIKLDPADKGKIDGDRVFPPTKVTKTYYIDNDNDPFYDKVLKVRYYERNGKKYAFKSSDNGFSINSIDNAKNESQEGVATKSLSSPYYIIKTTGLNGIGYFDENNNFIIEHFDENTDQLKVIKFVEK